MMISRKQRPIADPAEWQIPPIGDDPEYRAAAAELARLETRLRQTEERVAKARWRARGVASGRSNLDRARDLMMGGSIPGTNPANEIDAAEEEARILRDAISEQRQRVDEIVGTLSFNLASRFLPEHQEALRSILDGLLTIHDGLEAIRGARARRIMGGYKPCDYLFVPEVPFEIAVLGDPRQWATTAGTFRRWLEAAGIIKEGTV